MPHFEKTTGTLLNQSRTLELLDGEPCSMVLYFGIPLTRCADDSVVGKVFPYANDKFWVYNVSVSKLV